MPEKRIYTHSTRFITEQQPQAEISDRKKKPLSTFDLEITSGFLTLLKAGVAPSPTFLRSILKDAEGKPAYSYEKVAKALFKLPDRLSDSYSYISDFLGPDVSWPADMPIQTFDDFH